MARKRSKAAVPRDADATRARILEAAKTRFSQNSYEGVGVRDIAADAGADPALVVRYFGGKEALFRAIAESAFDAQPFLGEGVAGMPGLLARTLLDEVDGEAWRSGYDPLRLLLCSIGSATAGPIIAEQLDRAFIQPLSAALHGSHARERGALLVAHVIGTALVHVALGSAPGGPALDRSDLSLRLQAALAACVAAT
jgi:AcrR family transcriptional regulator